ncbi:hypothetical protein RCG24_00635 [Neobacillus sp. OS1-32]|uniref:hypothetical protein n=1 Tax=Neobacillus sp. OS1-32 TaxID=3070682 RepID=UPI0027E1E595|nr:hypothetical protein [Neobacillus sp. OS1-32]WML30459.1 hypothetical protein RCG24_00635 [Neobacillus sp. OS1-32]
MNTNMYMGPGYEQMPYNPGDSRLWGGFGWGFRPWGFGFRPWGWGFGRPFGFGFGFGGPFFGGFPFFI